VTISSVVDVSLAVLVLAVAGWTIVARDIFAAIVGFLAYGLLLALVWVRLQAVDVALTEAAIGGGMSGVLLLGAAARLGGSEAAAAERPGGTLRLVGAVLSAAIAAALAAGVLVLPEPAPTLAPAAAESAAATGLGDRARQSCHERIDGLSGDGHHAGEGSAPACTGRRVVAGARSFLGWAPRAGPPS
jgi:uncharacterized MnhB-related membrane protein